jgi:hypothetical protein
MTNSTTSDTDSALPWLRSQRLAKEAATREEQVNSLAKYRAQAAENRRELLAKFDQFDRAIAEIRHQLTVIEKAQSALAHQPPERTQ